MGKPGTVYIVAAGGEHFAFNLEAAALTVAEANDTICVEASWIDSIMCYRNVEHLIHQHREEARRA